MDVCDKDRVKPDYPPEIYKSFKTIPGRLRTYNTIHLGRGRYVWNNPSVLVQDLAETGFFALAVGDLVECAFCGLQVSGFKAGDIHALTHAHKNFKCPFLCGDE